MDSAQLLHCGILLGRERSAARWSGNTMGFSSVPLPSHYKAKTLSMKYFPGKIMQSLRQRYLKVRPHRVEANGVQDTRQLLVILASLRTQIF